MESLKPITEKDVRALAESRYWRSHKKKRLFTYGVMLVAVVATLILVYSFTDAKDGTYLSESGNEVEVSGSTVELNGFQMERDGRDYNILHLIIPLVIFVALIGNLIWQGLGQQKERKRLVEAWVREDERTKPQQKKPPKVLFCLDCGPIESPEGDYCSKCGSPLVSILRFIPLDKPS